MISEIISHALLAISIWLITTIILKKKTQENTHNNIKKNQMSRQIQFIYNPENGVKKKKKSRHKKKDKKVEFVQTMQSKQQSKKQQRSDLEDGKERSQRRVEKQNKNIEERSLKEAQRDKSENKSNLQNRSNFENSFQPQEKLKTLRIQTNNNQNKQLSQQESSSKSKQFVNSEIQLLRAYFINELQQIVPYNGRYGHYKLNLEGSTKSILIEWSYQPSYPRQLIDISMNKQVLNPLQLQKLQHIVSQQKQKFTTLTQYLYVFNLATSIYQDLLIQINFALEQQKVQKIHTINHLPTIKAENATAHIDLKRPPTDPIDIKAKKEIYGKILDQIFYLHDMIQKPDISTMLKNPNQQISKTKQSGSRGRYWSEFQQLELIGEGGFGRVYKVRHRLDGNVYAIKKAIVNYEDFNDRKILKQVALLSKLNHPNIVRYYQSWLQDANSIQEIISDMEYSENEASKIEQINQIYNNWKQSRSGFIAFESASEYSYNGSVVENSGIVFEDDEDSDIAFEDGGQDMEHSNRSSINQATQKQNHSSGHSSVMNNMQIFPFKILYIAMQFCSGINLREFINTRFDEEQQKIQILRGILEGLAYIHQKKIIHRDLKPANIFLTENNKVKIGDFGLATSEDRSMSISLQSYQFDPFSDKTQAVGTGFYRAPEQLKSNKYDEKVDIYSLGIIMLQLFYKFRTIMQRADVLKELTHTQKLPKEFMIERAGTDILQSIVNSLNENPKNRPSAHKLLQSFRNKYFSQLVSCIANPKHFQFSELLTQLFDIKNEAVTPLMWRDNYKNYITSKLQKIYHIHKANLFPTLPLIPVQDFQLLNNHKVNNNRNNKYLLITNRGVVLQYASNTLKTWLKYAKQDFRRKKLQSLEEQNTSLRRYTFQKVVHWQKPRQKDDLCFHQKMVTGFDIAYKLEDGFNSFYFCQILKVSEAITQTLNLTQKNPPIYLFHSQILHLLAEKYRLQKEKFYGMLLSLDEQLFNSFPLNKKINFLQQRNLPLNFARKFCNLFDKEFDEPDQFLRQLELENQNQILNLIRQQIKETLQIHDRIKSKNKLKWKILIPQASSNGFIWEIGLIKGLTSLEQYANGLQFCNYHIEMILDAQKEIVDVSIWCIGEYLEQQMQKIILQCWKNGLSTRWYDWQIGEREDHGSRYSIILKRKNERVHVMIRNNLNKQEKQPSFFGFEHFSCDVIKLNNSNHYH